MGSQKDVPDVTESPRTFELSTSTEDFDLDRISCHVRR